MIGFIVGWIIGSSIAIFIGWFGRELIQIARSLKPKEKTDPYVTNTYLPSKPYNNTDVIIQPKTPQQIQMETYEKIKRGDV